MPEIESDETITAAKATEAKPNRPYPGRERIPFPLAGEGCFMLFTLGGLAVLEETTDKVIGKDWHGQGRETCFSQAEKLLLAGNVEMIRAAVDAGLKRNSPNGKPAPVTEIDLDEIEWPIGEIAEAALNALAVAYHGKRYDVLLAEATAAHEAAVEEARNAWEAKHAKEQHF
jgi:hypothetical protein